MMEEAICGVVLAGGRSRRMGRDKALVQVGSCPLVETVSRRLRQQVRSVLINTNAPEGFPDLGLDVLPDAMPGWLGPLAGILTGLEWVRNRSGDNGWLVSVAVDTPWFPDDLAARLYHAARERKVSAVIAASGGRVHPVFGVWSVALADDLRHALSVTGTRKVMDWVDGIPHGEEAWPTDPFDPFTNINSPMDLGLVNPLHLP